ncbi:MerR family transcriptional regulator [Streptomyces sp. p1417]|uniref:MerR family transcriptional regulator n=1 Tax=Streptomyces typhae TaxID=2681492 RepID=A0A6L6X074_9ACTN|nr:MerR family transcriptional regulator [Streptomyces typhae]MVO87162.1 MerR family transcriptional regulator [Streptomyces typhae]
MRIGDAAAAAGTTPRALRFYEERGLLPPPRRTPTGQREYGPGDVARVRVVRRLLALGLTVEDLRACTTGLDLLDDDLLPPAVEGARPPGDSPPPPGDGAPPPGAGPPPSPPAAPRGRCGLDPAVAERRIERLDEEIARLADLRRRLARRVAAIRAVAAIDEARGIAPADRARDPALRTRV